MRKLILITIMSFVGIMASAQKGAIVHVDIEPDTCMEISTDNMFIERHIYVDLNNDGINDDLCMGIFTQHHNTVVIYYLRPAKDNLQCCLLYDNDTISGWWQNQDDYLNAYNPNYRHLYRYEIDGHYYYGWFQVHEDFYAYDYDNDGIIDYRESYWCLDRYAFCTIPDTPLPWGATSLADIDESEASTPLFPNPTTGMLTVTGKDLKQAEVFNTLGQKVLSKEVHGDTGQLDISTLPTGVYFVRITDGSGVLRMEKVIKE